MGLHGGYALEEARNMARSELRDVARAGIGKQSGNETGKDNYILKDWAGLSEEPVLRLSRAGGGFYDANNLCFYMRRTNIFCGLDPPGYSHY